MKKIFDNLTAFNPGRLFQVVFSKNKISKHDALKIQKDSYDARKSCKRDNYDKPYIEIIPFLDAPEYEIFCSAVMNLVNIAVNNKSDRAKIKSVLLKKVTDKNLSAEQKKYLTSQLDKISD